MKTSEQATPTVAEPSRSGPGTAPAGGGTLEAFVSALGNASFVSQVGSAGTRGAADAPAPGGGAPSFASLARAVLAPAPAESTLARVRALDGAALRPWGSPAPATATLARDPAASDKDFEPPAHVKSAGKSGKAGPAVQEAAEGKLPPEAKAKQPPKPATPAPGATSGAPAKLPGPPGGPGPVPQPPISGGKNPAPGGATGAKETAATVVGPAVEKVKENVAAPGAPPKGGEPPATGSGVVPPLPKGPPPAASTGPLEPTPGPRTTDYHEEKQAAASGSWWDQGSEGGGMTYGQRGQLIASALGAGVGEGLLTAGSNMVIDTVLNQAAKKVPYGAGFIAMGQIVTQGPSAWYANQKQATVGKIGAGWDALTADVGPDGQKLDWVDRAEGVLNILDGLNNIIGLLSTLCYIAAAASFLLSFIFPALIPFIPLMVNAGNTLGNLNTLIGMGLTILRGLLVVVRVGQIALSDADPAKQAARAASLRKATSQFTSEVATRKIGAHRKKAEQNKNAALAGKPQSTEKAGWGMDFKGQWGATRDSARATSMTAGALWDARKEGTGGRLDAVTAVPDRLAAEKAGKSGRSVEDERAEIPDALSAGTVKRGRMAAERDKARENAPAVTQQAAKDLNAAENEAAVAAGTHAEAQRKRDTAMRRAEEEGVTGTDPAARQAGLKAAVGRREQAAQDADDAVAAATTAHEKAQRAAELSKRLDEQLKEQLKTAQTPEERAEIAGLVTQGMRATSAAENKAAEAQHAMVVAKAQAANARAELDSTKAAAAELETDRTAVTGAATQAAQERVSATRAAGDAAVQANQATANTTLGAMRREGRRVDAEAAQGDKTVSYTGDVSGDKSVTGVTTLGYGQQGTGGVVTGQGTGALAGDDWSKNVIAGMIRTEEKAKADAAAEARGEGAAVDWFNLPQLLPRGIKTAGDATANLIGGEGTAEAISSVDPATDPNDPQWQKLKEDRERWAAAQREKAAEARKRLQPPPVEAEERVNKAASTVDALMEERDELTNKRADAKDLHVDAVKAHADVTKLEGTVEQSKAEATAAKADLDATKPKQANAEKVAGDQAKQGGEAEGSASTADSIGGALIDMLVSMIGSLPSSIAPGGGEGAQGAGKIKEGVTGMKSTGPQAAAEAESRKTKVAEHKATTLKGEEEVAGAEADTTQAAQAVTAMKSENADAGADAVEASSKADARLAEIEGEEATARADHAGALSEMDQWTTGHKAARLEAEEQEQEAGEGAPEEAVA